MIKLLLLAITQILLYIVLLTTNDLSTRPLIFAAQISLFFVSIYIRIRNGVKKMTVGEVRKICDGEPIQLIGSRTGKKLANSWNNVTEVLARYDNHESCGIFASMRVQTDRVNMPNYITPIICIWVTGE